MPSRLAGFQQLGQPRFLGRELELELGDACRGPFHVVTGGSHLLGRTEELGDLRAAGIADLRQQGGLPQDRRRVASGEQARHRGLAGVLVLRDSQALQLRPRGIEQRLRVAVLPLHGGELGLGRRELLPDLVVLLVDLCLQAVDLCLHLGDGQLGDAPAAPADGDRYGQGKPSRERGTTPAGGARVPSRNIT